MKLKHLFLFNALVSTFFGLGMLLAPGPIYALYGQDLDAVHAVTARMWGSAILGYALLTFLVRNAADSETRRALVLALMLYFSIGALASVYNIVYAVVRTLGWSTPALYLVLSAGYAYFHFRKVSPDG